MLSNDTSMPAINIPQQLPPPMSVGNLINVAIQIYRSRFRLYLGWAMRAALWLVAPFGVWTLMGLFTGITVSLISDQPGLQVLLFVVLAVMTIVGGFYCFSRSLVCGATISRLSYQTLLQSSESVQSAYQFVRKRMRKFLSANITIYFTFSIVYGGIGLIGLIILYALSNAIGFDLFVSQENPNLIVFGFALVSFLGYATLLFYFARSFVYDTILAVEEKVSVQQLNDLSWKLTQGNALRIIAAILTTGVITAPGIAVAQTVMNYIFLFDGVVLGFVSSGYLGFLLISTILIFGLFVFLPLWKILQSTVYYDLKARKEGIDLTLI